MPVTVVQAQFSMPPRERGLHADAVFAVDSGWSGTVTPIKTGYIFEPNIVTYTNVTADYTNQNYTAASGNPTLFEWTNESPYSVLWIDPLNWDPNIRAPGEGDTAVINAPPWRGPVIILPLNVGDINGPLGTQVMDVVGGTVVVHDNWNWRHGTGTGTINISGRPTITILGSGDQAWRAPDNGTGIINISGDPGIYVEGEWRGADGIGTFIVNMNGGRAECETLKWGDDGGGALNMSGGTIIVGQDMSLGAAGSAEPITINVAGGLITVGERFLAPSDANGRAKINLLDGTIDCNEFVHGTESGGFSEQWHLDIAQGQMIIDGNVKAAIDANVAAGRIIAYGGIGTILVDYYISNPGKTTVKGFIKDFSCFATAPSPEDGAENLCPHGVLLSWRPGLYAAMHDVYFGTDFDDVNNADDPNVLPGRGRQDASHYIPSEPLELGRTYYWRIDGVHSLKMWKGQVWSFTVENGQAYGPSPNDGLWYVPTDQVLSWTSACVAASHDVYLGTAWEDVNNANTSSSDYKGNHDSNSYDPCGLKVGLTYYWRIDGLNWPITWRGEVWSFTVEDFFVVVDDMEFYDDSNNLINDTWLDGLSNGTSSALFLGTLGSGDPVHDGNQSLVFEYQNSIEGGLGYYSEIEANTDDLQTGSDWRVQGVRALTVWFYGDANNDANATEQMYVALKDTSGPSSYAEVRYGDSNEDMNDIKKEEWQKWNIRLQDFPDVNLASVKKVYIGFGDRDNPTVPGGDGIVHFDDIRLYRIGRGIWVTGHSPSGFTISPIDHVDVTFSNDVNELSFTVADINMVGPSGLIDVNAPQNQGGNVWRISFSEQSTLGEYHLYIGPHIEDPNGNEIDQDADRTLAEYPEDIYDAAFILSDSTPPAVISITRQTPPQQLTNASQVIFAVVFSESVIGVQANNFSIDATGDQVGATIQSVDGSDANWTVTVDTVAGDGLLSIDLDQNLSNITDLTGLLLTGAFTNGESYDVDRTAPTVTLDSAAPDPTNTSPVPVTVTLSEASMNFTEEDITLTNATTSDFSGSGTSYSFNLVPAGQGLVSATVQAGAFTDVAGNGNVASSPLSRTYDSVSPAVTLDSAAPDPTNTSPIPVTVTLSEASTNFTEEDITLTSATVSDFSGSGTSYSFNLVPAGQGLVSATVPADAFIDAAGNGNVASSPLSRTYDTVSPTVSSVAVQTGLSVDVTFSEAMGTGVTDPCNYSLSGSGQGSLSGNPDAVWLQGGTTYRLTWSSGDMVEGGDITIIVDNVYDLAGNLIGTPNSGTHVGGGIVTPPTVIDLDPCSGSIIGRPNVDIDVAFSEIVVGIDASDMVISGDAAVIAGVGTPKDQGGNTWRFPITRLVEGTLDVSLALDPGDIEDLAGNDLANVMWSYEVVFAQKKIYWTNTGYGKIQRANPEIPSGETAATRTDIEDLITGLTSPYGIAVDPRRGKMYWTDPKACKVQCANLEIPPGETPATRTDIENLVTGLDSPTGIAIDVFRRKIYWTDPNLGKIQRANPDGSGVEDLITGLTSPSGIGIDVSRGKVYWTSISDGKIQGANLDGSGVEDCISGLTNPTGIAFDGDPNWGMYWTDYGAKKIQRGDYPGLGRTEDCLTGLSGPWDIAAGGIDAGVFRDKIYWTDVGSNQIQYAIKSGYGGAEDFITTGLLAPRGIVFYHEPLTIFVDDDADGANDGSSWADAFTGLQDALAMAKYGDEIWVADGIYKPDCDSADPNGSGDRQTTFQLINGVAIYGGYAGFGAPDPNERNAALYETILSGDLNGDDGPDFANNGENSYHVVTGSGTDAIATLDGFTVTGGNANGPGAFDTGAGLYIATGSPTIQNCLLADNSCSNRAGGIYSDLSNPTINNLAIQSNVAAPNEPNAGLISSNNINLQGDLTLEAGRLDVFSSLFDGPGQIKLNERTLLKITRTTWTDRSNPTVIRADVNGPGDIEIDAGQQLIIEGDAIVNLGGSSECNPDANTGGFITVDGSLVIRGNASLVNTNVDAKLLEFEGDNNIHHNNILLLESSPGFGGEFFVSENASIYCNTIISEGDRYLDLDPDPRNRNLNISNNRTTVIIKEGTQGSQGTLLELRAADYDCGGPNNPDCSSGVYQVLPNSPGFTKDPSENWVLEKLILDQNAKLNLTNRQGFEFQDLSDPNIGGWETIYVKELVMGPNAVLNTGLQTLYYQTLVDLNGVELVRDPNDPFAPLANGSRFQDMPLSIFSLGIIAMDDDTPSPHNEFDIRVRRRLRDTNDIQPQDCELTNSCLEGSIERIDDDANIPLGAGGVMEMRTQAPGRPSASSVAAKGAFARAGDEKITVEFEYMFIEDPCNEAELVVYLSDDPEVSQNIVEVARILPPNEPNQPGWIESGQFAVFSDTFTRRGLNFNRGTYIELELRGTSARCWVDNWDPTVGHIVSYIVVDDMESYNNTDNYILQTWIDGSSNWTSAFLGLGIAPNEPVHGGEHSMVYKYYNFVDFGAGYYSEIQREYADPCDWTVEGVRVLTLWFYGDADNDAGVTEQMYVGLQDTSGPTSYAEVRYGDSGEDMNDIRKPRWHDWNIALQDFEDGGVDLTNIKKVHIGFGDKDYPWFPGGSGTVYFDDIHLQEPICIPSHRSAAFAAVDLSGDCIIDVADLGILAGKWLKWSAVGDLYKDLKVDFRDYAILANRWLETEGMWP